MAPRLPLVDPSFDFRMRSANLGMAMAANMPMIATTIISSMSVKPPDADPALFSSMAHLRQDTRHHERAAAPWKANSLTDAAADFNAYSVTPDREPFSSRRVFR